MFHAHSLALLFLWFVSNNRIPCEKFSLYFFCIWLPVTFSLSFCVIPRNLEIISHIDFNSSLRWYFVHNLPLHFFPLQKSMLLLPELSTKARVWLSLGPVGPPINYVFYQQPPWPHWLRRGPILQYAGITFSSVHWLFLIFFFGSHIWASHISVSFPLCLLLISL